jgi:hypothetical protein
MLTLLLLVQTVVPPDLVALWLGGIGLATTVLTQLLKKAAAPLATAPDWVKAVVAMVVALVATKISVLVGAPIPGDLGGFAAVVVTWAAGMGLHALAKKLGVVHDAFRAFGR